MSAFQKYQFSIIVIILQIIFLILFGIFGKYSSSALPSSENIIDATKSNYVSNNYPLYQDVHTMAIIGFGFIMAFLRRYGFSSISLNLLLICFAIQFSLIIRGFLSSEFTENGKFIISIVELIRSDMDAIAVVIAMGALLGKLTPIQYIIMALIEVPLVIVLDHILFNLLLVNDVGRSMIVHTFGAIFGVVASRILTHPSTFDHPHKGSNYTSDILSLLGGLFLFVFFPSFNASLATPEDARHRAVLNSFFALVSCALCSFAASQLMDHEKKSRFFVKHIANSIIAGGIAIGTVASVVLDPIFAIIIGCLAAFISVFGYQTITPMLAKKAKIDDTRGVFSAHALPGIFAGFLGFIFPLIYAASRYDLSLKMIYPGVKSATNTDGREMVMQGVFQLLALLITILLAIIGGVITGLILKMKCLNQMREKEYFSDLDIFETPEDFDFTTRIISKIDHIELTEHTSLTTKAKEAEQ